MSVVRFAKVVSSLPGTLVPDTVYFVRTGAGFDLRVTDGTGSIAHELNVPDAVVNGGGVATIQKITQSAYDALDPPDPDTLYAIVD